MSEYIKTNSLYQQLEATMETEMCRYGLHVLVRDLMRAVREERDATQKELAALREDSDIKAFYIKQLEKAKGMNTAPVLEKIERDLIRMLNSATDALADVTALRTSR